LNSKSRETEKEEDFDPNSSEISSDSDSDVVPAEKNVNNNESEEVHRDSERLSRKDSGLPSSRSSLSSIASLQQSDLSPDDVTKVSPPNPVPPLKLSKNAEQVLRHDFEMSLIKF
jgi:hypothetical protein